MKYIIKEKQVLKILDMLFNTMYGDVRYKKDKSRLSVYEGDKLRRNIGANADGSWKLPTYIVEYYPNDESLWVSDFVYTKIKKFFLLYLIICYFLIFLKNGLLINSVLFQKRFISLIRQL